MQQLASDSTVTRRFLRWQWRVVAATMVGYTLFYFLRKNLSFAMPGLQQDYGITKTSLGLFLTLHGVVYGVSKFLNGIVGDRCNSKKFLSMGLFFCVLANVLFGFGPVLAAMISGHTEGEAFVATLITVLGVIWVFNGFFQSMGFPPCARLLAFWIPPHELATKMSVWNTSHSIGAGLVTILCGYLMGLGALGSKGVGVGMWRWCFWVPAILAGVGLLALQFVLPDTPTSVGLPELPGTEYRENGESKTSVRENPAAGKMIFSRRVFWWLGGCNFTINLVRFSVLDWGPTLLKEAKGASLEHAGWIVALFEISGIIGMLFSGWATDKWAGGRAPRVCAFMMAGAALFMFLFWLLPGGSSTGLLLATLCGAGFCIYGPQALTGVTATNLATKSLAGTAIGFISMFSYASVIYSGLGMGWLTDHFGGWSIPFVSVIGVALLGCAFFLLLWNTRANNYKHPC